MENRVTFTSEFDWNFDAVPDAVRTTVSLHRFADAAVLAAYRFSAKKDLLAQLLALNQQVAAKIETCRRIIPTRRNW